MTFVMARILSYLRLPKAPPLPGEPHTVAGEQRDLRRGAMQILGGSGVRMIARVLLITFVARTYGVDDFGRLGETVAMVELVATFATFGLSKTLLGKLGHEGPDQDVSRHIIDAAVLVGILSFAMTAAIWAAWPLIASDALASSQFVLLGIPLIALTEVATTATRHFRTAFWDMLVKAFVKPWSFLLLGIAGFYIFVSGPLRLSHSVSSEQALLMAYIGSLVLTAIAAGLALAKTFGSRFFATAAAPMRQGVVDLVKRSWPIALNDTGLFAFRRIDVIILAAVVGPKETAVYYMARQIGTVAEKVRHLFEPVLAPIIAQSRSLSGIGDHIARLSVFIFASQFVIIGLFAIFGGSILAWLGTGFGAGLLVVLVILMGELFDGSSGLCELPMVYRNPSWPPRLVLATLALEVVLVWILATKFGALGAAMGFAISMFVLAVMRIWMVRILYGFKVLGPAQFAAGALAIAVMILASAAGLFAL